MFPNTDSSPSSWWQLAASGLVVAGRFFFFLLVRYTSSGKGQVEGKGKPATCRHCAGSDYKAVKKCASTVEIGYMGEQQNITNTRSFARISGRFQGRSSGWSVNCQQWLCTAAPSSQSAYDRHTTIRPTPQLIRAHKEATSCWNIGILLEYRDR